MIRRRLKHSLSNLNNLHISTTYLNAHISDIYYDIIKLMAINVIYKIELRHEHRNIIV